MIGTADKVIPPALLTVHGPARQGPHHHVNAGHLSLISNPGAVAKVIVKAARATGWADVAGSWDPHARSGWGTTRAPGQRRAGGRGRLIVACQSSD